MDNGKTQQNINGLAVFKDNPNFYYVLKKTEKLVSAIYLLTEYLSDNEPLKTELKKTGLDLLTLSLSLPNKSFQLSTLKLLSLLEILFVGNFISEMNYTILKREFEALLDTVQNSDNEGHKNKGIIFPEHFFEANQVDSMTMSAISKGHNIMSDSMMSFKKSAETVRSGELKLKDKSNGPSEKVGRQDIIIDLLKKNKELGIKDFARAIKDCSEKTIQRELATLVSKGQIKKEGEKRWSRYSLK
jgi:hypothetical protein